MEELLRIEHITKQYPGVTALNDVSLSFRRGEVHALMGENGAGKSTLIKTIAGAIAPTSGKIVIDGKDYAALTPQSSQELGIGVIYQEFNLIPSMSVMENLFIGNGRKATDLVDYDQMYRDATQLFENFCFDIDVRTKVEQLSTGQQQIVEIAKSLTRKLRLLIMDEPSAALSQNEVKRMFSVIRKLKEAGVTIIYITHRMDEVFNIADRFSVLRDGKFVVSDEISRVDREKLIAYMVGRELKETYPPRENEIGAVVLKAEHLSSDRVDQVSLELHQGEILGLAGLVGAGRTELAKLIFGADRKTGGTLYLYTCWKAAADEGGFMICVLHGSGGTWGKDADEELLYAEAVFYSTLDRCRYCANESVFYIVGYGKGASAALEMGLRHCDLIAGMVICGTEFFDAKRLDIIGTQKVGFCEERLCRDVAVHAWLNGSASAGHIALLNYLKTANCAEDAHLHNDVADVYLQSASMDFSSANERPVAQLWSSTGGQLDQLAPLERVRRIWGFLRHVKRWRGAVYGSLRPAAAAEQQRLIRFEKIIDGYRRYWYVFIPSRYYRHPEEHYPLVLCTHGYSCSAEIFAGNSDWHLVAEARNFFVIYATALPHPFNGENWTPLPMWNCGYWEKETYPDDCRYLLETVDDACARYPIDPGRIYAAGHSNGGAMCQQLMFRCPERFAAFSPAGYTFGDLGEDIPLMNEVSRPMLLHKSRFDLFSAADMTEGQPNMRLAESLCKINGASFRSPQRYRSGQYEHWSFLTGDRVPMVQFCLAGEMNHTYTPELAWITWDSFFAHFKRDADGESIYTF